MQFLTFLAPQICKFWGVFGAKWQSSASHTVRYKQSWKKKKPKNALDFNVLQPWSTTHLGRRVGSHATLLNADRFREFILANSVMPPDLDSGPTGSTRHRISSLQKPPSMGPLVGGLALMGLEQSSEVRLCEM